MNKNILKEMLDDDVKKLIVVANGNEEILATINRFKEETIAIIDNDGQCTINELQSIIDDFKNKFLKEIKVGYDSQLLKIETIKNEVDKMKNKLLKNKLTRLIIFLRDFKKEKNKSRILIYLNIFFTNIDKNIEYKENYPAIFSGFISVWIKELTNNIKKDEKILMEN